ncbi:peptide chain release factor N(5)-glutamine methyltransferase [Henriciella sp.]|uniref:peptide chain release factor N(5)-glutamine methyltransferase n=1 Tax=Henriciella sp. TaxID=1968823 RepID=UPI002617C2E2|nr:peptide chain release factor N(5)-glutamine methyltransferase [Henriciella sp.]
MHEANNYKALLVIASKRLKAAGIYKPAREARRLIMHASGLDAAGLISSELSEMPPQTRAAYFDLIERRTAGEPFEYLTGEASFYGLDFICSSATLIPRADSEVVVDEALARLPLGRKARVADLGTGTGCLLIALMKNHPGLQGIGIEQSSEAAEIARRNLARHGLTDRALILPESWTDTSQWHSAELVIANPPYIAAATIQSLDKSVKAFEPLTALDGGDDGLEAYRSIISLAAQHLSPGAWLVFEIGYDQREAVSRLLQEHTFTSISSVQDHGLRDRVVSAKR